MTFNPNTWLSFLTTTIGTAAAAAATDGFITGRTSQSIAGAAAWAIPYLWGWYIHRDSKVVQIASLVQGVEPIKISPAASPALQALAADRSVPTVKAEIPAPSPYATQRRT